MSESHFQPRISSVLQLRDYAVPRIKRMRQLEEMLETYGPMMSDRATKVKKFHNPFSNIRHDEYDEMIELGNLSPEDYEKVEKITSRAAELAALPERTPEQQAEFETLLSQQDKIKALINANIQKNRTAWAEKKRNLIESIPGQTQELTEAWFKELEVLQSDPQVQNFLQRQRAYLARRG